MTVVDKHFLPAALFRVAIVNRETSEVTPLPGVTRAYPDGADFILERPVSQGTDLFAHTGLLAHAHEVLPAPRGEDGEEPFDVLLAAIVESLDAAGKPVSGFAVKYTDADWIPPSFDTSKHGVAVEGLRLREVRYSPGMEELHALVRDAWKKQGETEPEPQRPMVSEVTSDNGHVPPLRLTLAGGAGADDPTTAPNIASAAPPRPPFAIVITGADYREHHWTMLNRISKDHEAGTTEGKVYVFAFPEPEARIHVVPLDGLHPTPTASQIRRAVAAAMEAPAVRIDGQTTTINIDGTELVAGFASVLTGSGQ